jgi:hypothetical protein
MFKYSLYFSKLIFLAIIISLSNKAYGMEDQTYQDDNQKASHLKRIQDLHEKFNLENLGMTIFSKELDKNIQNYNFIDSDKLFLFFKDHTAEFIDLKTGKNIGVTHTNVYSYDYSNKNKLFFLSFRESKEKLYSKLIIAETGETIYTTSGHIQSHEFSHNDELLLIKYYNGDKAELINTRTGNKINEFFNIDLFCLQNNNTHFFFSNNDKYLFLKNNGNKAKLIETQKGSTILDTQWENKTCCPFDDEDEFMFNNASSIEFSNDDKILLIKYELSDPETINIKKGKKSNTIFPNTYYDKHNYKNEHEYKTKAILLKADELFVMNEYYKDLSFILSQNKTDKFIVFKIFTSNKQVNSFISNLQKLSKLSNIKRKKNGFCDTMIKLQADYE